MIFEIFSNFFIGFFRDWKVSGKFFRIFRKNFKKKFLKFFKIFNSWKFGAETTHYLLSLNEPHNLGKSMERYGTDTEYYK